MTYRQLLLKLGTEAVRNHVYENTWVELAMERIRQQVFLDSKAYPHGCVFLIPDVRFLNEAKCIKDQGGIVVRVDRPGHEASDIAEKPMLEYDGWDHVIRNHGLLSDLRVAVKAMLLQHNYLKV